MWKSIHPDIVAASKPVAEAGKFDDAIFAAFRLVEGEIQQRIGSGSIGQALIGEAFDGATPRIDISPNARDRDGIRAIFSGALSHIRNDRGHKKAPFLPCVTMEACLLYLHVASFLLYLLGKDRNSFPRIETLRLFGTYDQPRLELRGSNFAPDPTVLAGGEAVRVVYVAPKVIEALLPAGFSGTVRVVRDGNASEERDCEAQMLRGQPENTYDVVTTELPLYSDEKCTQLRQEAVGLLVRATEGGKSFLRIMPARPGLYQSRAYVTHGPFVGSSVGETWYRDPQTRQVRYAWTSSMLAEPRVLGPSGSFLLAGLSILPEDVRTEPDERRTLRVFGWGKDGPVHKEVELSREKLAWQSDDESVAAVDGCLLYPKKFGATSVHCEYQGFRASASVSICFRAKGARVTYFQGLRNPTGICFDRDDNLYVCNQSASVYQIARKGGFREVARIAAPEDFPSGVDCIATDQHRNLYLNDNCRRVCLRLAWDGQKYGAPTEFAKSVPGPKKGMAVDSQGHVFVAVMGLANNGLVIHVEPDGTETAFSLGGMGLSLALDPEGNLCVPISHSREIHVYSRTGEFLRTASFQRDDSVSDIAVHPDGTLYLSLFHSGEVIRIPHNAALADPNPVAIGLGTAGGISVDSKGRVYVSDFGGNSIHLIY